MLFPAVAFAAVGMFPEREISFCGADQYGRRMREFPEAPFTVIGAHAGVACAVEWDIFDHELQANLVDAAASVLLCGHDMLCPAEVFGEEIKRQTVLPICYGFHDAVDFAVRIGDNRQKRGCSF